MATVYVGTGEGNSVAYSALGLGDFRSQNGGDSWKLISAAGFAGVGF